MKKVLVFAVAMAVAAQVVASEPFQASLTPEVAIHDSNVRIDGLVLSIWGENPQTALALGIVNGSTGDSAGLSWSFLLNYSDNYKGVQWAPINYNKQDFLGWQAAFLNYTGGSFQGLQTGWLNYVGDLSGIQFGLVNFADSVDAGLQVGFLNFIAENTEWFTELPEALAPAMVFVNWRF